MVMLKVSPYYLLNMRRQNSLAIQILWGQSMVKTLHGHRSLKLLRERIE